MKSLIYAFKLWAAPEWCGSPLTFAEGYFLLRHRRPVNLMHLLSPTAVGMPSSSPSSPSKRTMCVGGKRRKKLCPQALLLHKAAARVLVLIMQISSRQILLAMCLENKCPFNRSSLKWLFTFIIPKTIKMGHAASLLSRLHQWLDFWVWVWGFNDLTENTFTSRQLGSRT